MIGRTIGRYKILEKLGEGGMGSVWKAEDPVLRRTVAIKVLSASLWTSDEARERFLREARSVSRLEHPGIAAVYDFGEVDGSPFIAFQFVAGRTFNGLLEGGPLPPAKAFELAAAAADALSHAHARNVLHRDVTANNLMLADDGRVVLVDFGLALPGDGTRVTRSVMSMGTVGYMAPEMFRGDPASERTDLYGLGAVLYRLITGRLPFQASSVEAMMYRTMNDPLEPPSQVGRGVPHACDGPLMRALQREPGNRFASAPQMAAELRATLPAIANAPPPGAISGMVTDAMRTARPIRPARAPERARRIPWPALIAVAALAAVSAAAVWMVREGRNPFVRESVVAVLTPRLEAVDVEELGHVPDALGEQLSRRLGELSGLRVLPWVTTRSYLVGNRSAADLGRKLHARFVVDGSLEVRDTLVEARFTLVDVRAGREVDSVSVTVPSTNLFGLESRVALAIAARLKGVLSDRERRRLETAPSGDPQAYDALIRGAYYLSSDDPATRSMAEVFFRKALDRDPKYADAWVALGAMGGDRYFRGEGSGLNELTLAERNYRRALELDPKNLRAIQGLVLVEYEQGRAEEVLKLAQQAGPKNSRRFEVLLIHGIANMVTSSPDRAVKFLARALELDPANAAANWYNVVSLCWAADYDGCIQAGRRFVQQFGEDGEVLTWMGVSYMRKAQYSEARLCFGRAIQLLGEGTNMYVISFAATMELAAGDIASGRALAARWLPEFRRRVAKTPDNVRAVAAAMELEAVLGDTAAVRERAEGLIAAMQRPGSGAGDLSGEIWALCLSGDRALAVRFIEACQKSQDGSSEMLWTADLDQLIPLNDSRNPHNWPEFQSILRTRAARREAIRRKY